MNKTLAFEKTKHSLHNLITMIVQQELYNILGDPDEGLKLRPSVVKRLKESQSAFKKHRENEVEEKLNPRTERLLKQVERDIKNKKNLSPAFSNSKDAIAYLKKMCA